MQPKVLEMLFSFSENSAVRLVRVLMRPSSCVLAACGPEALSASAWVFGHWRCLLQTLLSSLDCFRVFVRHRTASRVWLCWGVFCWLTQLVPSQVLGSVGRSWVT